MAYGTRKWNSEFEGIIELATGGLNTARPPHFIADNEVQECINFWLTPTGRVATRGGFSNFLTEPAETASVRGIWFYPTNSEILFLVGNNLYKTGLTGGTCSLVGALTTDTNFDVTATNFQNKLFFATGGALKYYDYTVPGIQTVTADTYSNPVPQYCCSLFVWQNRLWVGDYGSNLYFSGVLDPTDWGRNPDTPEGEGLLLNGGNFAVNSNDGARIVAMSLFNGALIVHKGGVSPGIFKIIGDSSSTYEYVPLVTGLSASRATNTCSYDVDSYFATENGLYSVKIIDQLGNIESMPVSLKINPEFNKSSIACVENSDFFGYIFCVTTGGEIFCFHRGANAWYRWNIPASRVTVIASVGNDVFIGNDKGMLLKYDHLSGYDNKSIITSELLDKVRIFNQGREFMILDLALDIRPLSDGVVIAGVLDNYSMDKKAERQEVLSGSAASILDRVYLDFFKFDMGSKNIQVPMVVNNIFYNVSLRLRCSGKIELLHVYYRGAKISRKGVLSRG